MLCENPKSTEEGWSVEIDREEVRRGPQGLRREGRGGGSWGSDQTAPGRKHNLGVQGRGVAGLATEDLRYLVCWGHKRQQKEPREFQLETWA